MYRLRESSSSLERQAFSDPLTGLPNRAALYRFLASNTGSEVLRPLSILFLDLDGFKQINDMYGHTTGDLVLIAVGKRLRQLVRGQAIDDLCLHQLDARQDSVIRLGGDEFTIILTGDENAEFVARRIVEGFQTAITLFLFFRAMLMCYSSSNVTNTHTRQRAEGLANVGPMLLWYGKCRRTCA